MDVDDKLIHPYSIYPPFIRYEDYYNYNNKNNNDFSTILKKIFELLNIKNHFIKVFGTETILVIGILTVIKLWLKKNIPYANDLLFKDKLSSINISYTHYTNNYHLASNSESDAIVYKSILYYIKRKNILGVKYLTDTSGYINYFSKNDDIRICRHISFDTKNTINGTYSLYEIDLYSFTSDQRTLNKFIKRCVRLYLKSLEDKNIYINRNKNHKYYKYNNFNNVNSCANYEEHNFQSNKNFNNVFFRGKEEFLNKINLFCNNKKWYIDRGLPYSLGIILHGPPGTGKTSCIKAIANLTNRSIIDVSLNKVKCYKELRSIFLDTKINNIDVPQSKRIYVFEDIDCIFDVIKDRNKNFDNQNNNNLSINNLAALAKLASDNKNDDNIDSNIKNNLLSITNQYLYENDAPITLDVLLNIFDGVIEPDGRIIIMTTNKYEMLDKAFIRPGRFDCHLFLDNADINIICDICKHFTNNELSPETIIKIEPYITHNENNLWSPAKIIQICMQYLDKPDFEELFSNHLINNYNDEVKNLFHQE